jgi:hypothetical protein
MSKVSANVKRPNRKVAYFDSFFAAAIQIALLRRRFPLLEIGFFDGWETVYRVREIITKSARQHSPIIRRDLEILDMLEPLG